MFYYTTYCVQYMMYRINSNAQYRYRVILYNIQDTCIVCNMIHNNFLYTIPWSSRYMSTVYMQSNTFRLLYFIKHHTQCILTDYAAYAAVYNKVTESCIKDIFIQYHTILPLHSTTVGTVE